VKISPIKMKRDVSDPWAIAIITLASSVPVGLFVNWLAKKLIDKTSTKITINRKEIYFDKGEVTRLIEETKEIEQNR
jgi:hypothetical protein